MMNLLLAIHCHQPVGNFSGVFDEAYEKAYLPFIEVLNKHPKIKISLHYSGNLLDWLVLKHPEFITKIKNLVKQGRVEIITGGYYEPILSLVPLQDAQGQITMLTSFIKKTFGFNPIGGWLTERIWEPKMPYILSSSGIEYTIVDDWHFKATGFDIEKLSGYYLTEEEGHKVILFASSEKLRYLIPFKEPKDTIDYLRHRLNRAQDNLTLTFGDDGEKFGLWSGTHKWVYKKGWLDNFFSELENNSDWITLFKFSDYLKNYPASGQVYLPCVSYREMGEWSGGYFRNFLVKYPETNFMHKRMLCLSNKLSGPNKISAWKLKQARRYLYMAQTNCSYWHGVFGGLYLNHLRSAVYSNLIEAEKTLDNTLSKKDYRHIGISDFDSDGSQEIIVNTKYFKFYFKPDAGAGICEWDDKNISLNLVNTIMRRPERCHNKLLQQKAKSDSDITQAEVHSIHNINKVKNSNLKNFLFYDRNSRYSFLDHFLDNNITVIDFYKGKYKELGDFVNNRYDFEDKVNFRKKRKEIPDVLKFRRSGFVNLKRLNLVKTLSIKERKLYFRYRLENQADEVIAAIFAAEFNFSIYDNLLSRGIASLITNSLKLNDIWNNIKFNFNFDRTTEIWHFPVETISESEANMQKIYQELCLIFRWSINLKPREIWEASFDLNIHDYH